MEIQPGWACSSSIKGLESISPRLFETALSFLEYEKTKKEALMLYYYDGFSLEKAGDFCNCGKSTMHIRVKKVVRTCISLKKAIEMYNK